MLVTAGKATLTSMMCTIICSCFTELSSCYKGPATTIIMTEFANMPALSTFEVVTATLYADASFVAEAIVGRYLG